MRVLIEAAGSPVSNYIIENIQAAGHEVIASDIDEFNHAKVLADEFVVFPKKNDPDLWNKVIGLLVENKIDVVVPSFDEMMVGWAKRKEELAKKGIHVIISSLKTIDTFQSKWNTFLFFTENNIPTPKTAFEKQDFDLVKPNYGRGAVGVEITKEEVPMEGMISQEVCEGTEYTIDVLFDRESNPVYIVPRKRLDVREGKSTKGITTQLTGIEDFISKIAKQLDFYGPINFQCFEHNGKYKFIECNPRIAGGMALGIAATENWFKLLIDNIANPKNQITSNADPKFGLKMARYYAESFFS